MLYIGATQAGFQPGTRHPDLSEHINGAASQTPCTEPSFPAQVESHSSAAVQSHTPEPRAREEGVVCVSWHFINLKKKKRVYRQLFFGSQEFTLLQLYIWYMPLLTNPPSNL